MITICLDRALRPSDIQAREGFAVIAYHLALNVSSITTLYLYRAQLRLQTIQSLVNL